MTAFFTVLRQRWAEWRDRRQTPVRDLVTWFKARGIP